MIVHLLSKASEMSPSKNVAKTVPVQVWFISLFMKLESEKM